MANGERQWATAVLRKLGKPVNDRSVSNLVGWARAEGGHTANDARYNYLNTTQPMPGAGNTGTQGNIKVYRSLQQGIDATVKTLRNGRYGGIIQALDSSPQRLAAAIDSSPWGTHNPSLASIIASASGTRPASGSYGAGSPSTSSLPASSPVSTAAPSGDGSSQQAALQQYLLTEKQDPNALLNLAAATQGAAATPADAGSNLVPDDSPNTPLKAPTQGAASALGWVQSKLGDPSSRETGGPNQGGLASYANKQFGMSGQPWCAMFTSMAVVKGGAPASARTASVAQVREKARAKQGYRGFVNPAQAKPGDLVLWGNNHIAMVQRVAKGKIYYIGGNQSDNVTQGETSPGSVDVVRPAYQ
jgi:hypothetical protein